MSQTPSAPGLRSRPLHDRPQHESISSRGRWHAWDLTAIFEVAFDGGTD